MQKVKHDFQVANREISFGNVCMIRNCFIFFRSYFMFNIQTINCMQYNSEAVVLNSIIKLGRNHARNKNTHGTLSSKTQWFALIEKKLFELVLNKEKKQGGKKEKLTESLHLTIKIARTEEGQIITLISENFA